LSPKKVNLQFETSRESKLESEAGRRIDKLWSDEKQIKRNIERNQKFELPVKKFAKTRLREGVRNTDICRSHKTLAEYLRSFVNSDQNNWDEWVDYAMFSYNTTPHSSTDALWVEERSRDHAKINEHNPVRF
jgi:hypothetical protein